MEKPTITRTLDDADYDIVFGGYTATDEYGNHARKGSFPSTTCETCGKRATSGWVITSTDVHYFYHARCVNAHEAIQ